MRNLKMGNNIKSLVENLLGEEVGMLGITTVKPEFTQTDTGVETVKDEVKEERKAKAYAYIVKLNGKEIDKVFRSSKETPEEVKKSLINHDGYDSGIEVEEESEIKENSELSLSPKSFRTLYNCFIAESMINETVEIDETLEKNGLITEGKVTVKGRDALKKYLPTLFAS